MLTRALPITTQNENTETAKEIRRGLITIARACAKRWEWGVYLLIVLGIETQGEKR